LKIVPLSAGSYRPSRQGNIALYATFENIDDGGQRRTADIYAGFTGAWGSEFLSFGVGKSGSSNDSQDPTYERMRLTSSNVSFNSFSGYATSTYLGIDSYGTLYRVASDKSLKKNIVPLPQDVIDTFDKLQPRQYNWKDESRYGKQTEFGFVANEIQELYPNLVYTASTDLSGNEVLGFTPISLVSVIVAVLQIKSKMIDEIKNENEDLKNQITIQKTQLNQLQDKITALEDSVSLLLSKF
jgi:hypothetical protein